MKGTGMEMGFDWVGVGRLGVMRMRRKNLGGDKN